MSSIDETIGGLRALADWLEEKRDALREVYVADVEIALVPSPHTRKTTEALGALLPNPRDKENSGEYLYVRHRFTPQVSIQTFIPKSTACTRRQVGTRFVKAQAAVPARNEPAYKWDCESLNLLGPAEGE